MVDNNKYYKRWIKRYRKLIIRKQWGIREGKVGLLFRMKVMLIYNRKHNKRELVWALNKQKGLNFKV